MFKSKRYYEDEIAKLKEQIEDLKNENLELHELFNATPSDCKLGNYCDVCAFSVTRSRYLGLGVYNTVHYCAKGDCPSFVLKEELKKEGD